MRPRDDEVENSHLFYGLEKVGFSRGQVEKTNRDKSIQRFTSYFGCCPRTSTALFAALKDANSLQSKPSLLYFYMALAWLKSYLTERVLAGMFKVHENTVRTWVGKYAIGIQSLKEQKVRKSSSPFFILFPFLPFVLFRNLSKDIIRSGSASTKCLSILSRLHSLSHRRATFCSR